MYSKNKSYQLIRKDVLILKIVTVSLIKTIEDSITCSWPQCINRNATFLKFSTHTKHTHTHTVLCYCVSRMIFEPDRLHWQRRRNIENMRLLARFLRVKKVWETGSWTIKIVSILYNWKKFCTSFSKYTLFLFSITKKAMISTSWFKFRLILKKKSISLKFKIKILKF